MSLRDRIAGALMPGYAETQRQLAAANEALTEAGLASAADRELFAESLALFASEDTGWERIAASADQLFSAQGRTLAVQTARAMFITSAMIKQGIELQANYVFGRGIQIEGDSADVNQRIEEIRKANQQSLGLVAMIEHDHTLSHDGNVFFVCFRNVSTGAVKVRVIDSLQITDIITDPNDADTPWLYKRSWTERTMRPDGGMDTATRTAYYLDISLQSRPAGIAGVTIEDARILHVKDGGIEHWLFGWPMVHAAISWVVEHEKFLKRWAVIQSALARWAVKMKVPGGKKEVAAAKNALQTGITNTRLASDPNPPPLTASTFIGTDKADISAVMTRNATTGPDEARQLKLMIAAALGEPEHMFGDPSTSNLATAKQLDRPTELKFAIRQQRWAEAYTTLFMWALSGMAQAPNGRMTSANFSVSAKFPDILEHDLKDDVAAIISAATLDGKSIADTIPLPEVSKMLLRRLGIPQTDIERIQGQLFDADGQLINPTEPKQAQPAPGAPGAPPAQQATERAVIAAMAEAMVSLRQAVQHAERG